MKICICSQGLTKQEAILKKHISRRVKAEFGGEGLKIDLAVEPSLGAEESFCIEKSADGYRITGADDLGLLHGIGKFLHTAAWTGEEMIPDPPLGLREPHATFRAIYFTVHLYNWYQNAPAEELLQYVEDMALWGYSTVVCILPIINVDNFEDPLFFEIREKVRAIFSAAKSLWVKTGIIIGPNQGTRLAPSELAADPSYDPHHKRGGAGKNICLSKPGAMEYMLNIYRTELDSFTDIGLDYLIWWPYDEGGCGCEKCRPWGANMFLESFKLGRDEAKKRYPKIRFVVSTWLFDVVEDEGEFSTLYERLKGDMSWVDYVLCDTPFEQFPRYPLEHPPVKPVVSFPEISMWKLYPWGGFGSNPTPTRMQAFWDETKGILKGGMPYSEGCYEDLMKVLCAGFFWEPDRRWQDIVKEYANFEFGSEEKEDVVTLVGWLEESHLRGARYEEPDLALAQKAAELARSMDLRLPEWGKKAWRWRILYIRALLDEMRFACYYERGMSGKADIWRLRHISGDLLKDNAEAQKLFSQLRSLYHSSPFNGENQWTLPPLGSDLPTPPPMPQF